MKKNIMRLASAVLALTVCILPTYAISTNQQGDTMVRVGLASSSSWTSHEEQMGANLWNCEGHGAGYRFGYYDDQLNFVELARTSPEMVQVSIIKTQNTWFKGSDRSSYSNSDNGGSVVGCYHLQLPGQYDSYSQAAEMAAAKDGFVAYINGAYQVRAGAYVDKAGAMAAQANYPDSTIVGTSAYGMNVIESGKPKILFQYDMKEGTKLAVLPDVTGAHDVYTWFWGLKYRGGFTYQRLNGGNLTIVNVVELEDYVKGVTPYEMGRTWPLEALKAQAVCARTYVLKKNGSHKSLGFDVCTTDHCQVYNGVGSTSAGWGPSEISDRAVEETAGQALWYQNTLAETFYSSSHGGASENAKYIWGTDTEKAYPYLCGVLDPYEKGSNSINSRSSWTVSYTAKELTQRLNSKGFGVGASVDHMVLTYSNLGNVIKMEIFWSNGQKNTYKPSDGRNSIRSVFGVNSIRFAVNGQTAHPSTDKGDSYPVNGSDSLSSLEGVYVINGDSITQKADGNLHIVSGSGQISPLQSGWDVPGGSNEGGGTVKVYGNSYLFQGSGWGHQVGMSQFGAHAMSKQGFAYNEICEFYFPGTKVAPMPIP